MRWIALLVQGAISATTTWAAWEALGLIAYAVIAILIGFAILVPLVWNELECVMDGGTHSPGWFVLSVFVAVGLGAMWPILPIAVAWGAARDPVAARWYGDGDS